MHFWFICCVLLFAVSHACTWIGQQSWLVSPQLGLPWVVLGGIGLAIASNYSSLRVADKENSPPMEPQTPQSSLSTNQLPQSEQPGVIHSSLSTAKTSSISFEIVGKALKDISGR